MNILASDFSGAGFFLLIVAIVLLMTAFSFIPSSFGHWSGPLLAAPMTLLILFMLTQSGFALANPSVLLYLLIPLCVPAASLALYLHRRRTRET